MRTGLHSTLHIDPSSPTTSVLEYVVSVAFSVTVFRIPPEMFSQPSPLLLDTPRGQSCSHLTGGHCHRLEHSSLFGLASFSNISTSANKWESQTPPTIRMSISVHHWAHQPGWLPSVLLHASLTRCSQVKSSIPFSVKVFVHDSV